MDLYLESVKITQRTIQVQVRGNFIFCEFRFLWEWDTKEVHRGFKCGTAIKMIKVLEILIKSNV